MELRVNWDYLPFPRGLYSIRDLWGKKDCGRSDAAFAREIPSHDVVVLKLTPVKK